MENSLGNKAVKKSELNWEKQPKLERHFEAFKVCVIANVSHLRITAVWQNSLYSTSAENRLVTECFNFQKKNLLN